MKTLKYLAVVAWLAVAVVALLGCKSAEVRAYQSVSAMQEMVEASLKAWGEYCKTHEVTPETHTKIENLLHRYQQAADVAENAVYAYKAGQRKDIVGAATNLVQAANDLVAAINEVKHEGN